MKHTTTEYFAAAEDEESWVYTDPTECAQAAYDDGVEPVDGKIKIYSATARHYEGGDVFTGMSIGRLLSDFADDEDRGEHFADRLERVTPYQLDDLAAKLAAVLDAWASELSEVANPFLTGLMGESSPVEIDIADLDMREAAPNATDRWEAGDKP